MDAPIRSNGIHLGREARIRLPNVDEAIDIGYAFHAANDPALADTQRQRLAKRISEQFLSLIARAETWRVFKASRSHTVEAFPDSRTSSRNGSKEPKRNESGVKVSCVAQA
jgi:hypothetical protein